MSGAANSIWGPQPRYIRQLFTSVVAPRTDYGAIVWHKLKAHGQLPQAKINKLATPQRLAMKAIIGSFHTAPTSAFQHETQLPPPDLQLKCNILRSLTRIQTLFDNHPISPWIERAIKEWQQPTPYISNLESLVRNFPEYISSPIEKIYPFIRPP